MGLLTLKLGGYLNLTGKKLPSQICKNVQSTNTNSRHDQTSLENTKEQSLRNIYRRPLSVSNFEKKLQMGD